MPSVGDIQGCKIQHENVSSCIVIQKTVRLDVLVYLICWQTGLPCLPAHRLRLSAGPGAWGGLLDGFDGSV